MPIIIHTKDKTLEKIPFDTDENRKVLADAPSQRRPYGASVCAILHQDVLEPDKGDFQLRKSVPTLDNDIRQRLAWEIQQKKDMLIQAYPDLLGLTDGLAQLNSFPWPDTRDPHLTDLIKKFKDLKCPALGTGFYVGNNLVVTAAHCVSQLGPNNMGYYRLVYNFTDNKIPVANVFSIKRIVHYNANNQAPPDHGPPILPPPTVLPLNSPQVNMAAMKQFRETYDVAILELLPTSSAQTLPKPLALQLVPAALQTDVYSIGCSNGLPFIYADGSGGKAADPLAGTVRSLPDSNNSIARQGSITADIDVFKGNSGGPLFNAKTNEVLGICRSGMVYPWLGDTGGPDVVNSKLESAIRSWISTRASGPSQFFERDFLDFYVQLRTLRENTRVSWIRFKGDSGAVVDVNAFSRTDPYALLTMPLDRFLRDVKGHLSIVVRINDGAPFNPFGLPPVVRMQGDVTLGITGATVAGRTDGAAGSTLTLPGGGWDGGAGHELQWSFTTNAPGVGGVPAPASGGGGAGSFIGTLDNTLLPWAGGICGWDAIGITRTNNAGGGYQPGELEPLNGKITVTFTPPTPPGASRGAYIAPFVFQVQLAPFERVKGTNDRWISQLGCRYGSTNAAWWTGPI